MRAAMVPPDGANAHAGSRTRVTSMGGLYDAATLRALMPDGARTLQGGT